MECTNFVLCLLNITISMCVIYRPISTCVLAFCDELADYMGRNINLNGKILLVGDMNIPSNQQDHVDTVLFKDVLDVLNLHNHIPFPSHWLGNSLDVIINKSSDTFIMDLTQDRLFSDHKSLDELVNLYNDTLSAVLDDNAPFRRKKCSHSSKGTLVQ